MIISKPVIIILNRNRILLLLIFLLIVPLLCRSQDYRRYFVNKEIADSLVRSGRYEDALENIRQCVSVLEMSTVTDEFHLGYSFFKVGNIDSAVHYLMKALKGGFFFQKMEYVNYWEEKGVFRKFSAHKPLQAVQELLTKNTIAYINDHLLDSVLARELIIARDLDQKYRAARPDDSLWSRQMTLDMQNQNLLRKIIAQHGWPGKKLVGYHGSNAAFLIAQHADTDTVFQRECLGYIREAYYRHDVNAADYAYIIDRVRVNSGRLQLFGTQFYSVLEDGRKRLRLKPVEDEDHLNLRRRVFGLPPAEEYLLNSQRKLLR